MGQNGVNVGCVSEKKKTKKNLVRWRKVLSPRKYTRAMGSGFEVFPKVAGVRSTELSPVYPLRVHHS